jgi:hypothetical protein
MTGTSGEEPICCLLSFWSTHVQFSKVWHVKKSNLLSTCQAFLTDLRGEKNISYTTNIGVGIAQSV